MLGGSGGIGPAWTRGEIEKPAGEKDMGSWKALVYTEEQQARLGGQPVAQVELALVFVAAARAVEVAVADHVGRAHAIDAQELTHAGFERFALGERVEHRAGVGVLGSRPGVDFGGQLALLVAL